jgi:transcriptional regulator with XRE-family HTH domain
MPFKEISKYSEQVKRFRLQHNLSQKMLAEKLGVCFATINRLENRQHSPSKLFWKQFRQFEQDLINKQKEKTECDAIRIIKLLESLKLALGALKTMCNRANLNLGEEKAIEMTGWVDEEIKNLRRYRS